MKIFFVKAGSRSVCYMTGFLFKIYEESSNSLPFFVGIALNCEVCG